MPLQSGKDKDGCFIKWGNQGAKYHYECGNKEAQIKARKKALQQAAAEHANGYSSEKISFDYDGTLTRADIQKKAMNYIKNGAMVYIISAREDATELLKMANKLGILKSRVYATGSNSNKIRKVQELNIDKHYDNNENVVNNLGTKGSLVKLTLQERFTALIKFISNDNPRN